MYTGPDNMICNAKCPYYDRETKRAITCEGIVDGGYNIMKFPSLYSKSKFVHDNCMKYPNECSIAKYLDKKYGADL